MKSPVCVVIPNWDGADMIGETIDSLKKQSLGCDILVVDNGSKDGSLELLRPMVAKKEIILIELPKNIGFAGGVNVGFDYAINHDYEAVATLNNDAVADKDWLTNMFACLQDDLTVATVTCKILSRDGKTIDSTGDWLSIWGLPYPRGRGEQTSKKYDEHTDILGASGGASLFRTSMLKKVGLYDPDFFAYYEDIDLSLRTRLAGWQIRFEPRAFVLHATSSTGNRVRGFTTLQTMKNLPWILIKDIPASIFWRMLPRFALAYLLFFGRAIIDGRGLWALRGIFWSLIKLPKKIWQRIEIQRNRKISPKVLNAMLLHDLPPNAKNLRRLRNLWWRLRGKA
jgi:GT2 family glycosyltransferase